jgi:16S rRNA (cytosine967-C5)-methyltransferase
MLHHAAAAVRLGGRLIYSTCSSEPEENEMVVMEFLDTDPRFRRLDLRAEDDTNSQAIRPVLDDLGFLRTTPDQHGLEAFFGAVLRRVE